MARIEARSVCVDFPITPLSARSIKNVALSTARRIGGQFHGQQDRGTVVRALDQVSFSIGDGDRLGLLGPNGSGKTTLIRVLGEIYAPTSGDILVDGVQLPMFDIGIGFDPEASGYENIRMRGLLMGLSMREIEERMPSIADFSELGFYLDLPIRTYSAGMLLRLMFSIATSVGGNIVLMDEWIAVGDAEFRAKANARLREVTDQAGILVIASHDNAILRDLCNVGLCLSHGQVKFFGPIEEAIEAHAALTRAG